VDNLRSKHTQLDARTVALLGRLFVLLDTDGDESLTVADAQAACADLDGCCVDPEPFSRAVTRVVGSYSEDLKLNAAAFVAVRAEYAELVDTAAGGMRLHGRLRLAEALAAIDGARRPGDHEHEHEGADAERRLYATTDVTSHLPEPFLLSTVLPARRRASAVLRDLFSPATADQLTHALTGRTSLAGASQRVETLAGWAGRVDVAHVVAAPGGRVLYILDRQVLSTSPSACFFTVCGRPPTNRLLTLSSSLFPRGRRVWCMCATRAPGKKPTRNGWCGRSPCRRGRWRGASGSCCGGRTRG
jgi:hypothetical protein